MMHWLPTDPSLWLTNLFLSLMPIHPCSSVYCIFYLCRVLGVEKDWVFVLHILNTRETASAVAPLTECLPSSDARLRAALHPL
ncbi:hypothetical protein J3F83DRAFT_721758 [Trichoderma novae-zelandiae]